MSVSDELASQPTPPTPAPAHAPIADPAPLGLAAFALTTFLLGAAGAGWMTAATGDAFLGYALAYGGLAQLLAGMWEFRNRNVFGATAFSSYGAFWIGLALWALLVHPASPGQAAHDQGWIFLAFAIFNAYMLLMSAQVNMAVFCVFLTLQLAEIILFIGNFAESSGTVKFGGYIAVLTALVAWYASAAGLSNGIGGKIRLPLGKPLVE